MTEEVKERWWKFYPKLHDDWKGQDPFYFSWWCWMLSNANWRDEKDLKRGQLRLSVRSAAKIWKTKRSNVQRFWEKCEENNDIHWQRGDGGKVETIKSIITILNYDKYQDTYEISGTIKGVSETKVGTKVGTISGTINNDIDLRNDYDNGTYDNSSETKVGTKVGTISGTLSKNKNYKNFSTRGGGSRGRGSTRKSYPQSYPQDQENPVPTTITPQEQARMAQIEEERQKSDEIWSKIQALPNYERDPLERDAKQAIMEESKSKVALSELNIRLKMIEIYQKENRIS